VDITAISTDSGISATDFITNDNNGLTISATLSTALVTGEKLFYSKDNGTTWTDITSSVNGTAVSHVDSTLTSSSTIRMQVRNAAGSAGATDSQLVTIDSNAPTATNDTASAKEAGGTNNDIAGTNPTGNVLSNDSDSGSGNILVKDILKGTSGTATAVAASSTSSNGTSIAGNFGTLKIGADGSYVYTVDNANATVEALNDNSTALTDVFTYTVQDSAGLTSTATITVSVNGATDTPTLTITGAAVDGSSKTITFGADTATRIEEPEAFINGVQVTSNVNTTNVDTVETTSVKVEYKDLDSLGTTTSQDMRLGMSGFSAIGASASNWILEMGRSNSQGSSGTVEIKISSKIGTFNSIRFDYADLQSGSSRIDFFDANDNLVDTKSLPNRTLDGNGNATRQTFNSGTLTSAASYFKIIANHDNWNLDTLVLGTTTQTLPTDSNTVDSSPILQGSVSAPVTSAQEIQIFDGSTKLGVATLDSSATSWTFAVTAASAGAHTYTAKLVNKSDSSVITTSGVYNLSVNVSPLVLDLNGDGVQTTTLENGTQFDLINAGSKQSVAWIDKQDGLLAIDLNSDGQINSGLELFGNHTQLADGTLAKDGWSALAQFDGNADGMIDANDEVFNKLKIWVDGDSDGRTDLGELRNLVDVGVRSINLEHDFAQVAQNGNILQGFSSFTTTDGQNHQIVDAWLKVAAGLSTDIPLDASTTASSASTSADPQPIDFVNGKAPYEFTPEELATILPQLEQVSEPGVYSMSLGQSLDLNQLMDAGHATATALAQIDMATDTSANVLSLSLKDVLSLPATDGVHQLKVTGAANDKLMLAEGDWTDTGAVVDQGGHRYALYTGTTDSTAQLLIDQQILQSHQSN
jgi:VCBS repeat-containing protein